MSWNVKPGIVIHRKISWLLLFSIFSLAFVSWLIYKSKSNIEQANDRIDKTYQTMGMLRQLLTTVSGDASDAYLFLANSDPEAASRLRASHTLLSQDLDSLQRLTNSDHDQQKNIPLLQQYLISKHAFEDSLLNKAANLPQGSATHRTRELNGRITTLLYAMLREEQSMLNTRRAIQEATRSETAFSLIIGRTGGFLFVVIILLQLNTDITRRKKAQVQLVKAMQDAQEARQMQEQFLANMSHEIRTPMNGIKGMTDLLLGTPLSEKQHELTGMIKSSVDNLLVIINDILDFSKIKAGKLNIEKIPFRLKDVLDDTTAIFDHRLKKKGIPLRIDLDPAIPDRLIGDPHRLNQVLINLLGNAIKFTDQGHINIRVTTQQKSDAEVILSFTISDTGIGIPADSLPYIFDSFAQAGQDISRRYGGTGLGLSICKQLLHLQGGEITVESTSGMGASFSFRLPYGYSHVSSPLGIPSVENITDYTNTLTGKHFLVAEDNEINQKLIDYVLTKAGGIVELVNNGAEAIRYLQHTRDVDLIIMDLQMPEMDGYTATKFIRGDLHMQTPIIAMTATAMKGEQVQCLESGMNEYMTKPFEFAELYKRINSLLS